MAIQIIRDILGWSDLLELRRRSGLVVNELDSQLEGRGFDSHPILDGSGVKATPGSIPALNL